MLVLVPSVQGPGFLPATACGASIHVSLPEVKAIFLAKGSGERPDAAPAQKRDFWRPDLVVGLWLVSTPALSFFRETNCSRLWCLPSRSSTCRCLRQAVAFREHAEHSCGPGGTGSSGFGSSAAAGAAGAWSRARCVSSCTFYAVDVGFFGNCLLAAPGLIKALPSPSCLARGGFGDAGAD